MSEEVKVKCCTKCGKVKPVTDFYTLRRSGPGRRGDCKKCCSKKSRDYVAKNPEKRKRFIRVWNARNPDKVKRYAREWGRRNPDKVKQTTYDWKMKNKSRHARNQAKANRKTVENLTPGYLKYLEKSLARPIPVDQLRTRIQFKRSFTFFQFAGAVADLNNTTMKITSPEIKNLVSKIAEAFDAGWKHFERAGKLILQVEAAIGTEAAEKLISAKSFRMTQHVQKILKRVAGDDCNAVLVGDSHPNAMALVLCDVKLQNEVLKGPFQVVTYITDSGAPNVEHQSYREVHKSNFERVLDKENKRIRDVSQQTAMLKDEEERKKLMAAAPPAPDELEQNGRMFFLNKKHGYAPDELITFGQKMKLVNQ